MTPELTIAQQGVFVALSGDFEIAVRVASPASGFIVITMAPTLPGNPSSYAVTIDGVQMVISEKTFRLPVSSGNALTISSIENVTLFGSLSYT